jgi:hypothetical protein
MQDRPAEAVEPRDLQRVAIAKQTQKLVEPGAARLRAARVVNVDVLLGDAGAAQRVDLVVGDSGRRSRRARSRGAPVENTRRAGITVVVSRRELSTPKRPGNARISQRLPEASTNGRFSSLCIPSWVAATVVEKRCARHQCRSNHRPSIRDVSTTAAVRRLRRQSIGRSVGTAVADSGRPLFRFAGPKQKSSSRVCAWLHSFPCRTVAGRSGQARDCRCFVKPALAIGHRRRCW